MGFFNWLRGIKHPGEGVPALPPEQVHAALLGVNRATAPYVVRAGGADEPDLVAEWRVVDAQWRQVFAKAGINKVFQVKMRLDPENQEVRSADQEWSVEWVAGAPHLSIAMSKTVGQKHEMSFGQGYAFTEHGEFGEVYNYRFDTGELKRPLRDAVLNSGWTWRPAVKA